MTRLSDRRQREAEMMRKLPPTEGLWFGQTGWGSCCKAGHRSEPEARICQEQRLDAGPDNNREFIHRLDATGKPAGPFLVRNREMPLESMTRGEKRKFHQKKAGQVQPLVALIDKKRTPPADE
jgi:hypothetical protein